MLIQLLGHEKDYVLV